jgi:drug/metabolite transporter (DMT)-like permease
VIGRYRNAGLFVLLAGLFGVSFVAIEAGLGPLPPLLFAGIRFSLAVPLLLAYCVWRYDAWLPRTRADYAGILVAGVAVVAGNNGLLFLGQQTTTPAAASVMYGLNPILAPVFALLLLGQRVDRRDALGILLGLAGVVVIVQPSPETLTQGSTIGQLLVLGAAVSVAFGSVLLRRFDTSLDSVPLTAWAMALGAVSLYAGGLALGEQVGPGATAPRVLLAVLSLSVLSTAFAYPIYFGLIRDIGPIRANLVAYLVPVVAALTGWALLREPVTPETVLGFLVVVTGVALLERRVLAVEVARLRGEGATGTNQ